MVAALGGTLAFLELTGGKDDTSSADDSSAVIKKVDEEADPTRLIDVEAADITSVVVDNQYGGFTLERPASGKSEWNIKELTGLDQISSYKSDIATDLSQLESYKTVEENAEDLSKYGLAEPEATFTVHFADGTERTFLIGDIATKNRYRYFCEKDSKTVYMVVKSIFNNIIDRKEEFVNKFLIEDSSGTDPYGELRVKRKDLGYEMVFVQDESEDESLISAQVMTEPIFANLNISVSAKITHGLYGLTASRCEKIFPTEEDFGTYGLDDPQCTVTFKGEGYDYELRIGNEIHATDENGKEIDEIAAYYCYVTGVDNRDCIWQIDAESLLYASFMPGDVISLMTTNRIENIDTMKVTVDGKTHDYKVVTDSDGQVTNVRQGNNELDVYGFKSLYQFLLSCPTDEIYFDEVTGEPEMTVELSLTDGETETLEYYRESARRTIVALNGRPSYRIESRWVDGFKENVGLLEEGKELKEYTE